MTNKIFVVVREMEESGDFQKVEVLQRRSFTDETEANKWRDQLNEDFGGGFSVVPLQLEQDGTVNVIETNDGNPQSLRAFFDNEDGNKQAEKLFRQLVNEHVAGSCDVTDEDVERFLEDGIYEDGNGYAILIVHSTT